MYFIYGKRTQPWVGTEDKQVHPADKQFRALNGSGIRVSRLTDAIEFATREDAQEFIDKHNWHVNVELEIRKKN